MTRQPPTGGNNDDEGISSWISSQVGSHDQSRGSRGRRQKVSQRESDCSDLFCCVCCIVTLVGEAEQDLL